MAAAESAFAGRFGCTLNLDAVKEAAGFETARILFCETPSRFLVSVAPEKADEFEETMAGSVFAEIGTVDDADGFRITRGGKTVVNLNLSEIETAWKSAFSQV